MNIYESGVDSNQSNHTEELDIEIDESASRVESQQSKKSGRRFLKRNGLDTIICGNPKSDVTFEMISFHPEVTVIDRDFEWNMGDSSSAIREANKKRVFEGKGKKPARRYVGKLPE